MSESQDLFKDQYKLAFGAGVLSRLRMQNIDPVAFSKRAHQSPSIEMQKVAEVLDIALHTEQVKTADAHQTLDVANLVCVRYATKLAAMADGGGAEAAQELGREAHRLAGQRIPEAGNEIAAEARKITSEAISGAMNTGSRILQNASHIPLAERAKRLVNSATNRELFDEKNQLELLIENTTRKSVVDQLKDLANESIGTEMDTQGLGSRMKDNLLG